MVYGDLYDSSYVCYGAIANGVICRRGLGLERCFQINGIYGGFGMSLLGSDGMIQPFLSNVSI